MNSNIGPRVIIVDDRDNNIKYSPGWIQENGSQQAYQHTLHLTQTDSSFSYGFEGTAISVVGEGILSIDLASGNFPWTCAVDGKPIARQPLETDISVLCSAQDLADTRHVLTVNVTITGGKLPFWVDSIQYVPSKSSPALENGVMLIDDDDPGIKYDSGWKGWEESTAASVHNTTIPGSSVSFNFTGIGISWVTVMSTDDDLESRFLPSTGTYIIDDEEPVSFNFAAVVPPKDPRNQVLFETRELQFGKHTLKVTYNGNTTFHFLSSNSPEPVDLSLDYLLVANAPVPTSTPSQTSQPPPKPTGLGAQLESHGGNKLETAIIGGIIGGVVFLCLLLGIGFVLWRRKVRRRYQIGLASEEDHQEVEPFPVTSAMREAPRLDKLDQMIGKVLAQELLASQSDQSESSNNAALSSNTNTSPTSSGDLHFANDAEQLVRHEDSGIRLYRDVVEIPPEYTER